MYVPVGAQHWVQLRSCWHAGTQAHKERGLHRENRFATQLAAGKRRGTLCHHCSQEQSAERAILNAPAPEQHDRNNYALLYTALPGPPQNVIK